MRITRRAFLASSAAALASARLASSRGLVTEPALDDLVKRALAAATRAGASYADVRIVRHRSEALSAREDRLEGIADRDDYGVGVRVIASGAWGFAASPVATAASAERLAQQAVAIARASAATGAKPVQLAPVPANVDVWQTALTKHPDKIAVEDKVELLLAINREAMKVPGVKFSISYVQTDHEWKLFASTDGAYLEQELVRINPGFVVTAIDDKRGESAQRSHDLPARQAGWEYVEQANLVADARRVGEEAVEKLRAPSVTAGTKDLVIDPTNLWLVIHESIGHGTELDRAMGFEANFAGTSYATPDKLGKLMIGAKHLTFYADKTTPGGLATCGYDDDGVATQKWNLVENGRFVGYQTTREQAGWIGEKASRGSSYADGYASFPFQRMPNVSLAPAAQEHDLIAGVDDGILVVGDGSWSIDHQRLNFQFGGGAFWQIKSGKRRGMLKDVAYQANTIAFWNACDAIGGPRSWRLGGSMSDGKGEPMQIQAVSHGCPAARFRGISVVNTGNA